MNQQPFKIEHRMFKDGYGNTICKKTGEPIKFREYYYKNDKNETVVIQEHSLGHTKASTNHGSEPHFNTRELDHNGKVKNKGNFPNTHGHYNF